MNKMMSKGRLDERENILFLEEKVIDKNLLGSYEKVRCLVGGEPFYLKYDLFQGGPSGFYLDDKASVSETFASAIAECSDIHERMRCAVYKPVRVRIGEEEYTATLSEPFLREGEEEMFLSTNYSTNCLLPKADFLEAVRWADRGQKIVDAYATRMPRDKAEDYVKNLSAFDILTLNSDRVENAYNCSIAACDGRIEPVNMDFGKCFGIKGYTKTMEEGLKNLSKEEIRELFDLHSLQGGSSFFSLEELEERHFEPFRLREEALQDSFARICRFSEGTDHEIYARIQAQCILEYLKTLKGILWN